LSAQPSNIDSLVRARFSVKDSFQLPDREVEYRIDYRGDTKANFVGLQKELRGHGLTPWLQGTKQGCVLLLKKAAPVPKRSRFPVAVAFLTLASIVIFALLQRVVYEQLAPRLPGLQVIVSYAGAVLVILAVHELGHRYIARRTGSAPPTPYIMPGIPDVTYFLPSLGAVSSQRSPAINKDKLFDVMLFGPLFALLAAISFYALGDLSSVQSTVSVSFGQIANSSISLRQINPNLLQTAVDSVLTPYLPKAAQGYSMLSPLGDGATVGFLLTFISFLPMASFDGGYLSSLAWGQRVARVATYLSVLTLIALDTPNYWALAVVVLVIAGRPVQLQLLDQVSDLSQLRKLLYLGALLLAFLSLPIPQNIATLPLG